MLNKEKNSNIVTIKHWQPKIIPFAGCRQGEVKTIKRS